MSNTVKMYRFVFSGVLLFAVGGTALAQDPDFYPKIETAPAFTYVHNSPVLGGSQSFNCAGGGSTFAYNFTSLIGLAADLSGCKVFGLDNTYGIGSKVGGNEFTYVFGPRITFRKGKFHPFFEVNFGGERVSISCNNGDFQNACGAIPASLIPTNLPPSGSIVTLPSGSTIVVVRNPTASSASKNAFAMTVGGGADLKLSKKFALRLVQAEYLYTRFGNDCQFAICSNNNSQNSFRLKSGIVIGWGGAQ